MYQSEALMSIAQIGLDDDPLKGRLDIDLGFSRPTNLLPIRRLALAVGRGGHSEGSLLRHFASNLPGCFSRPCFQLLARICFVCAGEGASAVSGIKPTPAITTIEWPHELFDYAKKGVALRTSGGRRTEVAASVAPR